MALRPTTKDLAVFQKVEMRKFKISSAQIITGTTPITNVIPAERRMIIYPVSCLLMHPAGTAYASTARLNFRYTTGAEIMLSGLMTNFLTLATASRLMVTNPAGGASLYTEVLLDRINVPIEAVFSAASTTGTFALYGLIEYRKIPSSLVST
jgi:hypothetical protein